MPPHRGRCWPPCGVFHAAEPVVQGEQIDELALKGFSRPVQVFDVTGVHEQEPVEQTEGSTR